MNIALIIAGGCGRRMGQDIPKQFICVKDKPIIIYTLEVFQKQKNIDKIVVSCLDGWQQFVQAYARQFQISKLEKIVVGGENGQNSIWNGLSEIASKYNGGGHKFASGVRTQDAGDIDNLLKDLDNVCKEYKESM